VSHQCLRESWALHFDYYSTTKKTASRLTKRVWKRCQRNAASFVGAERAMRLSDARDTTPTSPLDFRESQKRLRIGHFSHV
jgi:hypothetical protein